MFKVAAALAALWFAAFSTAAFAQQKPAEKPGWTPIYHPAGPQVPSKIGEVWKPKTPKEHAFGVPSNPRPPGG